MPPGQVEKVRQDMEGYERALTAQHFAISTNEDLAVKKKLDGYEQGELTIDDLNENAGEEGNRELIGYYFLHPDDISTKAKYPISRSFRFASAYPEAATLAQTYVNVYPDDSHAWSDLGYDYSILFELGDINTDDQITSCYDNAVRLGDTNSIVPLALSALVFNHMDVANRVIPELLMLHQAGKLPNEDKPAVASILLTYAITANREDIFIETLNSEDLKEILRQGDVIEEIKTGFKMFKGEEIKKIRKKVKKAQSEIAESE